jgi:hypothetical protein
MVPGNTVILPELENFPHNRFSKSISFTRFQLETSLVLGSDGITMNIFDMIGNGIMEAETWKELLAGEKEYLSYLKSLGFRFSMRRGGNHRESLRSANVKSIMQKQILHGRMICLS